jgi:hypothetical protein
MLPLGVTLWKRPLIGSEFVMAMKSLLRRSKMWNSFKVREIPSLEWLARKIDEGPQSLMTAWKLDEEHYILNVSLTTNSKMYQVYEVVRVIKRDGVKATVRILELFTSNMCAHGYCSWVEETIKKSLDRDFYLETKEIELVEEI